MDFAPIFSAAATFDQSSGFHIFQLLDCSGCNQANTFADLGLC